MGEWVIAAQFNTDEHIMTLSDDGSFTAYSKEYNEHYHSIKDGALHESLTKHVYPAFHNLQNTDTIDILDICFGLGFNTLATIYYHQKNALTSKVNIYSPELDASLIKSLINFTYPKEFASLQHIIKELLRDGIYDDETLHIELFLGDAREYIRSFENKFDIVYQDAFSPKTNPILWTLEYFDAIKKAMKNEGILTTYSVSLATRLALYENGFNVYIHKAEGCRNSTLASMIELKDLEKVNMKHKISCNRDAKPLRDCNLR